MALDPRSERWLFLEQERDVSEWIEGHGRDRRQVFSIRPNGDWDWVGPEKDPTSPSDRVLLLFIRSDEESSLTVLPRSLVGELDGTTAWNVWCHYGGDIELSGENGPEGRWGSWHGLEPRLKEAVWKANGGKPPAPYSKGQSRLPWSADILQLKRLVRGAREEGERRGNWRQILDCLERAWYKIDPAAAFDGLLRTLTKTLPAVLAARFLRAAISEEDVEPREMARRAINLYRSSGLPDQAGAFPAERFDEGLADLKQLYDGLRHTMVVVGWWDRELAKGADKRAGALSLQDLLWRLRRRLECFESAHLRLSEKATARLREPSLPDPQR